MNIHVTVCKNWPANSNRSKIAVHRPQPGLANLHSLTRSVNVTLRVDLMDFNGSTAYAVYNTFRISGSNDNYRLNVRGYSGTAGDSLGHNHNYRFSTYERDNDPMDKNCALDEHGAWWYSKCAYANLNGRYKSDGRENKEDGVVWYHWKNRDESLKRVEMKIKRVNFT